MIAQELYISLDALIYTDKAHPNAVSIDVLEFFSEKTKEDIATYVEICRQIEPLHSKEPIE